MNQRTLIRTLQLPAGSNARSLAESLTDDFNVASITGNDGKHEVRMVSPAELVVVIEASRAQFFREPILDDNDEDDEDEEDDQDEPDDPDDIAEEISYHLARRVGTLRDEDDDNNDHDATPDDDSDLVARRVVERLLKEGLLELVTPRSRPGIEGFLAHRIAHKRVSETLCDDLADAKGVAELYTSDEQLYEIIAACRPKRSVAPAPDERKPRPADVSKTIAKSDSKTKSKSKAKATASDKPTVLKPRKGKM